ncbi:hypothetical protein HYW82_00920, partial [Candidatus Peregrinibacteria bacterium]|nr:hypothetical protein [Candidatus Peregrinibacteria bacterium]
MIDMNDCVRVFLQSTRPPPKKGRPFPWRKKRMKRFAWVAAFALLSMGNIGTALAQSQFDNMPADEVARRAASIQAEALRRQGGQATTDSGGFGFSLGLKLGGPFNSGSRESAVTSTLEATGRYMFDENFGWELAVAPGLWWTESVSPFHFNSRTGGLLRWDWFTAGVGAQLGFYQNPDNKPPHYGAFDIYAVPGGEWGSWYLRLPMTWGVGGLTRLKGRPGLAIAAG